MAENTRTSLKGLTFNTEFKNSKSNKTKYLITDITVKMKLENLKTAFTEGYLLPLIFLYYCLSYFFLFTDIIIELIRHLILVVSVTEKRIAETKGPALARLRGQQ